MENKPTFDLDFDLDLDFEKIAPVKEDVDTTGNNTEEEVAVLSMDGLKDVVEKIKEIDSDSKTAFGDFAPGHKVNLPQIPIPHNTSPYYLEKEAEKAKYERHQRRSNTREEATAIRWKKRKAKKKSIKKNKRY